jgi:ABC-type phosphate/phosphonate transport system substrate-binding protein
VRRMGIGCSIACALLFAWLTASAANPAAEKVSLHPIGTDMISTDMRPLVLTAAPRDSEEQGNRRFGPLAEYLTQILGRKVVYEHPGTWGGYESDMQQGAYDIVFDGPHFVGWRVEKMNHEVLVKFPARFVYTAVVRKDEARYVAMKQLEGHTICAHPPPNLGTLIMFDQFDNPVRQPAVVVVDGYKEIYEALLAGKCDAAMLPLRHVQTFDPNGEHTRIIYQSPSMPEQALSVGPRISSADRAKLRDALLSPAAEAPLARIYKDYGLGQHFVAARNAEYASLGKYLRDVRGFY